MNVLKHRIEAEAATTPVSSRTKRCRCITCQFVPMPETLPDARHQDTTCDLPSRTPPAKQNTN
ncbi:MAG: hypothetical protein CBE00_00155 [Planctomycetaceae bacterium TMED240]|nr:hypothetical protein [Rhodopirellula sp.]OUX09116.1 MAG: hypothetical protein CBE00_00155 [Planctomycetaceae bacterium TMED240]